MNPITTVEELEPYLKFFELDTSFVERSLIRLAPGFGANYRLMLAIDHPDLRPSSGKMWFGCLSLYELDEDNLLKNRRMIHQRTRVVRERTQLHEESNRYI